MTDSEVVRLTAELVRIEGHEASVGHERAVADAVASWLEAAGVGVRLQPLGGATSGGPASERRVNVLASVRGSHPGPTLLWNAHLDTVPPYGMPGALEPRVRDGRLVGRGTADMKGALAAMLLGVRDLHARRNDLAGRLVFTAVAGEENGSPGMQTLVTALADTALADADDVNAADMELGRADFAVVGEPTGLRIARAHKGAMWVEVEFRGVAAHGSVPDRGVNAIQHAARFVHLIEHDLAPRLRAAPHPLLGPGTVNVGVIHGGDRPPMVPASCVVRLDLRWLPGDTHADVLDRIRAVVAMVAREDPRVDASVTEMAETSGFAHVPLECPADHPELRRLAALAREVAGVPEEPIGVQFWTDGALLAARAGVPTVVCGPGDIAQAHSLDEWVAVDQLEAARELYRRSALAMLSPDPNGPSAASAAASTPTEPAREVDR